MEALDDSAVRERRYLRHGLPLTRAEEAEVDRRVRLQSATDDLRSELARNESSAAGIWFDHAASGRAIVQLTDRADTKHYEDLVAAAGLSRDVEFRTVPKSLEQLHQEADAFVAGERGQLLAQGVEIRRYGPLVERNVAGVGLSSVSDSLRQSLEAEYPTITFYRAAELVDVHDKHNSGGPWKGSLWLHAETDPNGPGCSTGFPVRRSDGNLFLTTAGHCNALGNDSRWNHNWDSEYRVVYDLEKRQQNADAALLEAYDHMVSNVVILTGESAMEVTGSVLYSAVHDYVCASTGRTKQQLCGFVTQTGQSGGANFVVHNQVVMATTGEAIDGDSGSTIVRDIQNPSPGRYTGKATGILKGTSIDGIPGQGELMFTQLGHVLAELNQVGGSTYSFNTLTATQYRPLTVGHTANKCLDVKDYSKINGGLIQQWDCTGANNQKWAFLPRYGTFIVKNLDSGRCLDMPTQAPGNGTQFQQFDCYATANQRFLLAHVNNWSWPDFQMQVQDPNSYRCVDVRDRSTANGAAIQQYDCMPGGEGETEGNQRWKTQL